MAHDQIEGKAASDLGACEATVANAVKQGIAFFDIARADQARVAAQVIRSASALTRSICE